MKLLGYLNLTGVLTCETGLLIGGNDSFGIGGIDKPMIVDPFKSKRPYIPGSSLKGKMRHALEQRGYLRKGDEGPHSCKDPNCPICRVFGAGKADDSSMMTRLIVRDGPLIISDAEAPVQARGQLEDYCSRVQDYERQHGCYVEVKTENVIKRTTGTADKPRRFQRVPAGMKFAIDLLYRVFDDDAKDGPNLDLAAFKYVLTAFDLVRQVYLGASGSRGYGRISLGHLRVAFIAPATRLESWVQTLEPDTWEPDKWEPDGALLKLAVPPVGEGQAAPAGNGSTGGPADAR
jgi:CRISPR-associated protein Csm3